MTASGLPFSHADLLSDVVLCICRYGGHVDEGKSKATRSMTAIGEDLHH